MRSILFALLFSLYSLSAFAQKDVATSPFEKECRLAGGTGIGGGTGNAKVGSDIWLQMSYRLSRLFSVGTEFQYIYYTRPNYFYSPPPYTLEDRERYDNYVSFLIKYHLPVNTKLQFHAVIGWTYHIFQETYSYYEVTANSRTLVPVRNHYSNFAIPFIAEIYYPVGKIFQVGVRGKYNLNANGDDNTYAAGVALSVKL